MEPDGSVSLSELCAADSISIRNLYLGAGSVTITGDISATYVLPSVSFELILPNSFNGSCLVSFLVGLVDTTLVGRDGEAYRVISANIFDVRPSGGTYPVVDVNTTGPSEDAFVGVYSDSLAPSLIPQLTPVSGSVTLTRSTADHLSGSVSMSLLGVNLANPAQTLTANAQFTFDMPLVIDGVVTEDRLKSLGLDNTGPGANLMTPL